MKDLGSIPFVFLALLLLSATASLGLESACNNPPVAGSTVHAVVGGAPTLLDVAALTSDPDGDVLSVSLGAWSCSGSGSVADLGNGTFLVAPDAQAGGDCVVPYDVSDGTDTTSGTITVAGAGSVSLPAPTGDSAVPGYDLGRDPRRLRLNGVAVPWVGYYPGLHAFTRGHNVDLTNPGASTYPGEVFAALASHGVNYFRTVMTFGVAIESEPWAQASGHQGDIYLHPYARSTTCCTHDATAHGLARNRFDLDTWNPGFFDYWNAVLSAAAKHGVVVQLAILEARHTWGDWENAIEVEGEQILAGRRFSYFAQPNNVNGVDSGANGGDAGVFKWYTDAAVLARQEAFIVKAVEELGHHPNLVWEVANEVFATSGANIPQNVRDWNDRMADLIIATESADPSLHRHLVMPRDLPEHRHVKGHEVPGTFDNSNPFPPVDFPAFVDAFLDQHANADQPLVSDNDCCTWNGTLDQRRKKAWTTVIAGGIPLFFDWRADEAPGRESLFSGTPKAALEDVGFVRETLVDLGIDLERLQPSNAALTLVTGGPAWALADPGEEYLVYFLEQGSVDIFPLPDPFKATWINPRDEMVLDVAPNTTRFAAPMSGDWVLHIRRDEAAPPVPQTPFPAGSAPHAVPGSFEIEDFDVGGQNVAYGDSTAANLGPGDPYRGDEGVDARVLFPLNPRTVVTGIAAGEWLEHTVEVTGGGRYAAIFELASTVVGGAPQSGSFTLRSDGVLLATLTVAGDGAYHQVVSPAFNLGAGEQVFRLDFTDPAYHLDRVTFVRLDGPTADPETFLATSCDAVLEVPLAELLAGDLPAGEVEIVSVGQPAGVQPGTVTVDGLLSDPASLLTYSPGADLCGEGIETFEYSIARIDDPQSTAVGQVLVEAPTLAVDNALDAASCTDPVVVSIGTLLANDVPDGELEVTAAYGATGGTIAVPSDLSDPSAEIVFTPGTGFCPTAGGAFTYDVARIDDPTKVDSAPVTVYAPDLPDPVATDDVLQAIHCTTETWVRWDELLANDTPRPHIEKLAHSQLTGGAGTWDKPNQIGVLFQPNPAVFCAAGSTTFTYSIQLLAASGITDLATVTLVAPPRPQPQPDGPFFTYRDRSLRIPFDDLLANDGVGLAFFDHQPAVAGTVTLGSDGVSLTYSPPAGTVATDTFTYRVRSTATDRLSEPVTVSLVIGGAGPVANDDAFLLDPTEEAFLTTEGLLANDSGEALEIVTTSAASHGTVLLEAGGIRYLPGAGFALHGDSFTYTIAPSSHPGFVSTATVLLEPEPACDVLRVDDFETLPFSGWDHVFDGGGTLELTTAAASTGLFGLEIAVQPGVLRVQAEDRTPHFENDLLLRFDVDPSRLDLQATDRLRLVTGLDDTLAETFVLDLRDVGDGPQIQLTTWDDAYSTHATGWIDLVTGHQQVDIGWWSAQALDGDDGGLRLWLDRRLVGAAEGLANGGRFVDAIRLGLDTGRHAEAQGALAFDDYQSCRGPGARQFLIRDGFETDLSAWNAAVGPLAIQPEAALGGEKGLAVGLVPGSHTYVETTFAPVTDLRLLFRFDPAAVVMPDGATHVLIDALGGGAQAFYVKLRKNASGVFQLRLVARRNDGTAQAPSPAWINLPTDPETIYLEWVAGPPDSEGLGQAWLLAGTAVQTTSIDNDLLSIDTLRLGAVGTVDGGTGGAYFLDSVRVWSTDPTP